MRLLHLVFVNSLFDLILYVPDGSSWVEPVLSKENCVNTMTPVRLEPATPRS